MMMIVFGENDKTNPENICTFDFLLHLIENQR